MLLALLLTMFAHADVDLCKAIGDTNPADVAAALAAGVSPDTRCVLVNDEEFLKRTRDYPALFYAAELRKSETIARALVLAGANPELKGTEETCFKLEKKCFPNVKATAGMQVRYAYWIDTLRLLVSRGYQLEKNPDWDTIIDDGFAPEEKRLQLVQLYLEAGADENVGKPAGADNGRSLLSCALSGLYVSNAAKEQLVLAHHFTNVGKDTPAAFAHAMYEHFSLVSGNPFSVGLLQAFLAQGLDPNAEGGYLLDALVYSLNEIFLAGPIPQDGDRMAMVRLLVARGADVSHSLHTAIMISWRRDKAPAMEAIELLLSKGADLEAQNVNGSTPLFSAMFGEFGNEEESYALEKVKFLVAKGVNVNAVNKKGLTPLAFAEQRKFPTVAEYLRSVGAR